jgi:hypothetical protein
MPCIALTPSNTNPFGYCTDLIKLGNTRTKLKIGLQAFGASGLMLETQATERLYKDAPPGIPRSIPVLHFEPSTCLFQIKSETTHCSLIYQDDDFEVNLLFSLARLRA